MSDKYSGDIDPEIAALLNSTSGPPTRTAPPKAAADPGAPKFEDLFDGPKPQKTEQTESSVDFTKKTFAPIREFFEAPKPYFNDKDFYKKILQDMGESATKVHQLLTSLLNAQDPETRGTARLRLVPAWWDFLSAVVRDLGPHAPESRRLALRYGVLLPSLISPEQRTMLASIIYENKTGEPIHYIDEWLRKVGSGEIAPLATDEEVKIVRKGGDNSAAIQRMEKLQGQVQAQTNLINIKLQEIGSLESLLVKNASQIQQHDRHPTFTSMLDIFNNAQRTALFGIQEALKKLSSLDKELGLAYRDLEKMSQELAQAEKNVNELGGSAVDTKLVVRELGSLRQMCKMSCGRQGNHFPILMKQYMPQRLDDLATRENVLATVANVERLDPGLFLRTFKNTTNRIVPHMILLPSFGEYGLCWEPFEKFNRSTSRGRIAIPMYSKNLKMAVIYALGDLRWQTVKEKAGYRWMEEGLTGWYYQWFSDRGLKGDVREYFIQDYILWVTKESEGTQKLDKEVRGIFWRNMPFPTEIREMLKNRGFAYSELYKKDINRAMSDGY